MDTSRKKSGLIAFAFLLALGIAMALLPTRAYAGGFVKDLNDIELSYFKYYEGSPKLDKQPTYKGFRYIKCKGGVAIQYVGKSKSVTVPAKLKGKKVVAFRCWYGGLTKLNTSKAVYLEFLGCIGNKLTKLDISKNTKLKCLDCRFNKLKKLDISKNKSLTALGISKNAISKLDVSKHAKLSKLFCSNNSISKLNVSKNKNLTKLDCSFNKLKKLDVTKNTKLKALACAGNKQYKATLRSKKNTN